jgi:hypothetical protein
MKLIRLSLDREELLQALGTLSMVRRKRFGLVPVWLGFNPEEASLTIQEERAHASATIPAQGNWPTTGATVDIAYLRGAVRKVSGPVVELIMMADAILVPREKGYVRLGLLDFGDKPIPPAPDRTQTRIVETPDGLPLFRWALERRTPRSDQPRGNA